MVLRDAYSFEAEGAEGRSLGVSMEEASLFVDSQGFQERNRYLRMRQALQV